MNAKRILTHALLIFVWISVGFALGRQFGQANGQAGTGSVGQAAAAADKPDATIVYYFHGAKRCAGCNLVEEYARELLSTRFSTLLASGDVTFASLDYTQERDLAQQYQVAGNMIVVSRRSGGQEVDSRTLDDVMLRRHDKDDFFDYVGRAVQECLPGAPK